MEYMTPEMEIITFQSQDVLTLSDTGHSPWQTGAPALYSSLCAQAVSYPQLA